MAGSFLRSCMPDCPPITHSKVILAVVLIWGVAFGTYAICKWLGLK